MPVSDPISIRAFANLQGTLLEAEQAAEAAQTITLVSSSSPTSLARAGLAIKNLNLVSQRTGLGGKVVVELQKDSAVGAERDCEHGIRVGDIVRLAEQPKGLESKKAKAKLEETSIEGVVISVRTAGGLLVALKDADSDNQADGLSGRLWVVKVANDVTYRRMQQVMQRMETLHDQEHTVLMRVLFGLDHPTPLSPLSTDLVFQDPSLNESQKDAVRFALASKEIALIHGPPGTGKTFTLIELILQFLARKQRVLVCGPSNMSVDNIVERLAPHKASIIRLGHPARLLPSVLSHSLDVLTHTSEAAAIVQDVRRELDSKQASIKKTKSGRERREVYTAIKELRKEYRERERQCVTNLVKGSNVVLATLHGAGGFQLKGENFDVVIIDEASQALEAQSWIPLMSAKKLVLAGDHLQLPPTVKSITGKADPSTASQPSASSPTLETTMFDRLLKLHGRDIKRMLKIQYRMHEKICRFASEELYDGQLVAAEAVASRLLVDLPYPVEDTEDTHEPLVFLDTQGGDFPEVKPDTSESGGSEEQGSKMKERSKNIMLADSKSNPGEASLAVRHVKALLKAGVHEEDIAVITPYNAQLSLLSQALKSEHPAVELGSIDGFQGREKEAIILSLVRSDPYQVPGMATRPNGRSVDVGFLADKRRLNVAMTRPRRHLCVIGDSETVSKGSSYLARWIKYLEANADLRYPDIYP